MPKIISISSKMKGVFDDDYTLYDNGEILHEYDKHMYPGGYNLSENLSVEEIGVHIKERLLSAASDEDKELVKNILGI